MNFLTDGESEAVTLLFLKTAFIDAKVHRFFIGTDTKIYIAFNNYFGLKEIFGPLIYEI